MISKSFIGVVLLYLVLHPGATHAAALSCTPTLDRHAHTLGPRVSYGTEDWARQLVMPAAVVTPIEVYGEQNYTEQLPNGWVFALLKQPHGWSLRLFDQAFGSGRVDLSMVNPPLRGPNTRDLFGWHFRNADNSGPNNGEVNAPQALRPFEFAPALAGTAGIKPAPGSDQHSMATEQNPGRGWLRLLDYGLADLAPGEQARMNYLKAEGCLTWPRTESERRTFQFQTDTNYIDPEHEIMGKCGLDLKRYKLSANVAPRHLSGDFDGDGAGDDVMQVVDLETGQTDIALCRAGTWMTLLSTVAAGKAQPDQQDDDLLHTITALERWQIVAPDFAPIDSPSGNTTWPQAAGDVLVIERIEKAMYLVFFADGQLTARQVFRYVEPS
ncbi:MAG: hypothetical protein RJQ07_13630 [Pseudomonadales bacterium]